jgi:DNA-binding transcriptional LysR family regulator
VIVETPGVFDNGLSFHTSYSGMNTPFDWNLVRSFLAALDHGSLLGAARTLGASQPTLGRHIAELESQLGTVLFERTGRGLLPTPAALKLAAAARAMESGAHQLARSAAGDDQQAVGAVRISASQPVACYLLPPILARMRIALPEVQVELVSSNAVSNLLRREADIALRMVQPDQASLVAKRVAKITLGTYAHRDYLRRRGTPRDLGDLLAHDVIGGDRDETILHAYRQWGYEVGKDAFALRTDDLVAYWQAVRNGVGIGFVADYVAATEPQVVPLLPALKIPPLPIWLTVHREIRSNKRIRAVYDFLAQAIPQVL